MWGGGWRTPRSTVIRTASGQVPASFVGLPLINYRSFLSFFPGAPAMVPAPREFTTDRRHFLRASGTAIAATTLAAKVFSQGAHPGGNDTLKVGLIGAGGRGIGAAVNALSADANTRLTAIADTFADRAEMALGMLKKQPTEISSRVLTTPETLFSGFDGFKRLIDSGVDVVLFATPPHFRPEHLEYAIRAGKHCFVEKPVAVDVPGYHRVLKTCALAKEKGLAVVSGLCWRYHDAVKETVRRIQDGAIGEIKSIESHYNAGLLWHRGDNPKWSRMEYQVRNWLYHTWLSGDHIAEQAVHSLDKTAWLQGDISPIRALGMGGRQQRVQPEFGNIYDHFAVTYEYPTGVRVYFTCRQQDNCANYVDEFVIGTKGTAEILANKIQGEKGAWKYEGPECDMYLAEHQAMFASIRGGEPINNGHYMCNSTMLATMGRMSAYSGQELTWEKCLANEERLGPTTYAWTDHPEAPVAIPGIVT